MFRRKTPARRISTWQEEHLLLLLGGERRRTKACLLIQCPCTTTKRKQQRRYGAPAAAVVLSASFVLAWLVLCVANDARAIVGLVADFLIAKIGSNCQASTNNRSRAMHQPVGSTLNGGCVCCWLQGAGRKKLLLVVAGSQKAQTTVQQPPVAQPSS